MKNSSHEDIVILCATNSVAVLVCLIAAVLVYCLKLHRSAVYRLALYQVLASLAFAIANVTEILFVNYYKDPEAYNRVCNAIGLLVLYSEWTKLLFTLWVTFHLFCFGVLYKNMKKFEVMYVLTSLAVPAVITIVPLVTKTYGVGRGGKCWIQRNSSLGIIEVISLWVGPAMFIVLATAMAMVAMVIKMTLRVCSRLEYQPITDGNRFWKALKQLLPLAAFPILFFIFFIPELTSTLYQVITKSSSPELLILVTYLSYSLWNMSSGITLIVHISVIKLRCSAVRMVSLRNST